MFLFGRMNMFDVHSGTLLTAGESKRYLLLPTDIIGHCELRTGI